MVSYGYEEIEHTADWSIRAWGADLPSLFRAAAEGMLDLVGARAVKGPRPWRSFHLEAEDAEGLLVSWLSELLFALETEGLTFIDFDLAIIEWSELDGRAQQAPSERPRKEIKAVTYHDLDISRSERGLETVVVFDV